MNAAEDEFADDDIDLDAAADLPPLVTFSLPRDEVERWAGEVLRVAESATDAPGLAAAAAAGSAAAASRLLALLTDVRDRAENLFTCMIACGIEPQKEEPPTVYLGAPPSRVSGMADFDGEYNDSDPRDAGGNSEASEIAPTIK